MGYKWMGALLIISACGGFGLSLCSAHRLEERNLRNLIRILDFMSCELQYRMTPLPELCRCTALECGTELKGFFSELAERLESNILSDVAACMDETLRNNPGLPERITKNLQLLGHNLGRFDLEGQIKGLEEARTLCRRDLDALVSGRDVRLRNYKTLSLCAGAALAIILI